MLCLFSFIISVLFVFLTPTICSKYEEQLPIFANANYNGSDCGEFPSIKNGRLKIDILENSKFVSITCNENYDIFGRNNILCINGQWNIDKLPRCEKRCSSPPDISSGAVVLDQERQGNGAYQKGTVAAYSCSEGFFLDPASSRFRVCERGSWTGPDATCKPNTVLSGCIMPKSIENGFFVPDKPFTVDGYSSIRDKIQYFCEPGFVLIGSRTLQCLHDGWNPAEAPICQKDYGDSAAEENTCSNVGALTNTLAGEAHYENYDINYVIPGQVANVRCSGKYRDALAPCQNSQFRCKDGKWVGVLPICEVAHDCLPPPPIPFALIAAVNYENNFDVSSPSKFPVKSRITYQCERGYYLQGNPVMTCATNGCWQPSSPPICIRGRENSNSYFLQVNNINAVLISTATGAGVLGILLLVCLVVACRKRKALARAVTLPQTAPRPRQELNDHTILLQPDRLALIAFAESQGGSQNSLPTYEEAVRNERNNLGTVGVTVNRLAYRPHWPNLASGRRARNSPNSELVHVARHGSLASHTLSTRSCGDSMGSTDTVGVSEGSTNVTLDTASSHSGSQNPSCRAHCGSLASFDGCSLANTEGVPLLEESELEEIQGGNSNADNSAVSDNISSKVSTNSAPVMSA